MQASAAVEHAIKGDFKFQKEIEEEPLYPLIKKQNKTKAKLQNRNVTKMFDNTTIADQLRTVSCSNN